MANVNFFSRSLSQIYSSHSFLPISLVPFTQHTWRVNILDICISFPKHTIRILIISNVTLNCILSKRYNSIRFHSRSLLLRRFKLTRHVCTCVYNNRIYTTFVRRFVCSTIVQRYVLDSIYLWYKSLIRISKFN